MFSNISFRQTTSEMALNKKEKVSRKIPKKLEEVVKDHRASR